MPTSVAELLAAAAANAGEVDPDDLFDVPRDPRELVLVAGQPLAPLLTGALVAGVEDGRPTASDSLLTAFVSGLAQQTSFLAFREVTDQLLDGPRLPSGVLESLHDAMLSQHPPDPGGRLTAARLEVALRIVTGEAASKYQLMAELAKRELHVEPVGSLIAPLLGSAYQLMPDPADRKHLRRCLDDLEATVDVTYTRALIVLDDAAQATDAAAVVEGMTAAAEMFRAVADSEEGRDDATAYAAACVAVTAFTAGRPDELRHASGQARLTSTRRAVARFRDTPSSLDPAASGRRSCVDVLRDSARNRGRGAQPRRVPGLVRSR